MKYGIAARDYLARARDLCSAGGRNGLFYAAFEARCGIESRLQEYVEAQHEFNTARKLDWRIPKLGRSLARFDPQEDILEVVFLGVRLFYTPVTRALRKRGQQLGNLLHAVRDHRELTEPWWSKQWALVKETIEALAVATAGRLLSPPLVHRTTGEVRMVTSADEDIVKLLGAAPAGSHTEMIVRRLKVLPPDALSRNSA